MPETSPSFARRETLAKNRNVLNQSLAGLQERHAKAIPAREMAMNGVEVGPRLTHEPGKTSR